MAKKQKQRVFTEKEQRVAVEILEELIFSDFNVSSDFYEKIMRDYNLCVDPFTSLPCTSNFYSRLFKEYCQQLMFERYGHCDGLD